MNPSGESSQEQPAGSLPSGEPAFLAIGKFLRPHGVRGEMRMAIYTDFPERIVPDIQLYVGEDHRSIGVNQVRNHGPFLLITLEGYSTPEAVGEFRNQMVYVLTADRPALPDGEYYHHQLLGLQVIQDTGEQLGVIHKILETGANDVLVVRPAQGSELLLPMIDSVVRHIDLSAQKVTVHLLAGLISDGET